MRQPAATGASSRRIVLGVCGGIAAYKAAAVLRLLVEAGHEVTVVPTRSALRFVGEVTWAALSGRPVATDVWTDAHEVPHVALGRSADVVLVAPATADLLARAAHGRADDLLTNVLLTATCPVLMAPAMHTEMWFHAATQANVTVLRDRGVVVLEPGEGRLTGADTGKGRLPEPADVVAAAIALLEGASIPRDLEGRHLVISAGGTREPLDPVRFLGNRSSGRQGAALATAAIDRGARVTFVAAHLSVPIPSGVDVVRVGTARELHDAVLSAASGADAVVMAAAVADFRPVRAESAKIKKGSSEPVSVELERTEDVLEALVERRAPGQVIVGFAAETGDGVGTVLEHGQAKLARKGSDLLVVNDVGPGGAFGSATNEVVILAADGGSTAVPSAPKLVIAHAVLDAVAARLA
jgi:phosphopantothenoylcysteine decarboxylase/phosphopantothenate--cysteine ligase